MGDEDSLAKYEQIAADLRLAIANGQYTDRLPGERVLAAQYGVAAMTVRQALALLRSEGLAEARQGAGVFVKSFKPVRRHGIQRLARDRWASGASIWSTDDERENTVDQINVQAVEATDSIATALQLTPGDLVCRRSRRYVVEQRPVMLATSFLPHAIVAGSAITQPNTGPGGILARLNDLGFPPVHHREEIRYGLASPNDATRLNLPAGSPILHLIRTSYTADRRPIEVNQMVLDATAFVLDYEFDA
ncbi:GntR family transcriptional regulator [Streptacidiphilus anmyonensis]|uniref:GntR family transcriptional regulator n=1 Tax=Streptacidiphilus anmyonensis TaxID=405782 RepID=UPI0005AB6EF2|nr:GntR family transcriptional regulator [Streptacidiphilus anmyonensis]